ncbi:MAG: dihydroorotate dehydrogenase [Candidatus Omnitrophica bacterium]|nr:dihydroorotate dehydrogenase [Candidatus Omnitrophota bacterium]
MGIKKLQVELGKIILETPIIMASGTFGYGLEEINFIDYKKIGAITTKTITYYPWEGNPQPRIYETYSGMINNIGLQNPGVFYFIKNILPEIRKRFKKIFVSISGRTENEFIEIVKIMNKEKIDALELNLSCPNFEKEQKMISQSPELTYKIVKKIKNETSIPLIAKLSPNVTDIKEIAIAAEEAGVDIISVINTVKGLSVDLKKKKIIDGGLSGGCIKPIGLKSVYDIYKVVNIPIIGIGGIIKGTDAIEYFLVGASAIGIGSGLFTNSKIIDEVVESLIDFLNQTNKKNLKEITGLLNEKQRNN